MLSMVRDLQRVNRSSGSLSSGQLLCRLSQDNFDMVFCTVLMSRLRWAIPHCADQEDQAPGTHSAYGHSPVKRNPRNPKLAF